MVWCHKRKIIFIHIPKAGGSSVEKSLKIRHGTNGYGIIKNTAFQHFLWNDYKTLLGTNKLNNYTTFSICRNPYTRFISEYMWCEIPNVGHKHKQPLDDFIQYVKKCVNNENYYETIYHDHLIPQHKYIFDNKKLKVKHLFKLEEIKKLENFLKQEFNIKKLPHEKKFKKEKPTLTNEQKQAIYKIYQKDFELLNYTM